jgi:hypothetical protein
MHDTHFILSLTFSESYNVTFQEEGHIQIDRRPEDGCNFWQEVARKKDRPLREDGYCEYFILKMDKIRLFIDSMFTYENKRTNAC